MNNICKVVWSQVRGQMVVVSELVSGVGKTHSSRHAGVDFHQPVATALGLGLGLGLVLVLAFAAGTAQAQSLAANVLPTGARVSAGQANVSANGANMLIQQSTQRAAIDWQSFNIGSSATVHFNQPDAQSATLNRVTGSEASTILGRISAPGQVIISNGNGVLFGRGSSVDVGSLVATTHSIDNDAFMAGSLSFVRNGATGSVVNQGELRARLEGFVALMAPEVRNEGVIVAQKGTVALAAGELVELQLDASNKLANIRVEAGPYRALVDNRQIIEATDGLVLLSARATRELQGGIIKHSGSINASSLSSVGGRVVLTGDDITLQSESSINASGAAGGGSVLVGGDWQGSNGVYQASQVSMDAGASIEASAVQNGNGGKVVLWSDVGNASSMTQVLGRITARGGNDGGDGGRVETSGHTLTVGGIRVDAGSQQGAKGLWLLDPTNSTIDQTVANSYGTTLNGGADVLNEVTGDIGWNNGVTLSKTLGVDATLTLKATGNIVFGTTAANTNTISSSSNKLHLVLWSDSDANGQGYVDLKNSTIKTNGGNIVVGGGSGSGGLPEGKAQGGSSYGISLSGAQLDTRKTGVVSGDVTLGGEGVSQTGVYINNTLIYSNNLTILGTTATSATFGIGLYSTNIGDTTFRAGGDMVFTATNTYGTSNAGNSLRTGSNPRLYGDGNITINSTGYLNYNSLQTDLEIKSGKTYTINVLGTGDFTTGLMGAGSLYKTGTGTVTLSGATNYSGDTTVNNGTLKIQGTLSDTGAVNVLSNGTLELNNTDTVGSIEGAGSIVLNASKTLTAGNANDKTFSGVISGAGNFVKTGTGQLTLSGNNTYTGVTTVSSGTLQAGHNNALGTTVGNTVVSSGATLAVADGVNIAEPLQISGTGAGSAGALNLLGTNTYSGAITLAANATIKGATGTQTLSSTLNGAYALDITSSGSWVQTGAMGGTTRLTNLSLRSAGATSLGAISASGTVDLASLSGNLTLNGAINTTNTSSSAVTLNAAKDTNALVSTGGDVIVGGGSVSVGSGGRATIYSGSVSGSTGLSSLIGSGSGRFRYASDEQTTSYTTALGTGIYAIYREQPTANVTNMVLSMSYGSALPDITATGIVNGDKGYDITARVNSNSGNIRASATPYAITENLAALGYSLTGASSGTLTVNTKALTMSGLSVASSRPYNSSDSATVSGTPALQNAESSGTGTSADGKPYTSDGVSISGSAAGTYNSKDVASASTVTFSGLSLTGTDASNYTLTMQSAAAATITAKTVSLSASKTYDGTTALAGAVSVGTGVGSETLTYTDATASNAHVTTASKYINAITLANATDGSGGLASNYRLPTLNATNAAVTIIAATLTPTLTNTGVTKVYDGTTSGPASFSPSYSFSGLVSGDTGVSLNATSATYNSANVAEASTLTVGGLSIGSIFGSRGSVASDYVLDSTSKSVSAAITKANLSVTANNDAKFLALTDTSGFAGVSYSGFVHGETGAVLGGTLAVTRSNAGTSAAGSYSGVLVPSGLTSDNYTINYSNGNYTIVPSNQLLVRVSDVSNTYGSVTQYAIGSVQYENGGTVYTLGAGGVAGSSVSVNASNGVSINDGASGSASFTLAPLSAQYSAGNKLTVGSYQLGASGAVTANSANFSNIITVVGSHQVNTKGLTTSASSVSKVYDGGTSMTGVTLGLSTLETNDLVTVNGNGAFSDKNAGTGLNYTIYNLALAGADAGNYHLSGGSIFSGSNGVITTAPLTVTASNAIKTYDGVAYSGGNGVTYSGFVGGESASALGGALVYGGSAQGAANAGTYAITPSGLSSTNYGISYVDGALTINPAAVVVTGINGALQGRVNKVYDGTDAATLSPANYALTGWLGSDGATVTKTSGTYDNANAGNGKTVTVSLAASDYAATGSTNLSNYSLPSSISGAVGTITQAPLTVTASNASKNYDGVAYGGGNGVTFSGFVGGESASALGGALVYGGSAQGATNAGTYAITPSGLSSTNYGISYVDGALTINPAAVVVTGINGALQGRVNKVYDGTDAATLSPANYALTGWLGSDGASITKTSGTYDNANAGSGKTVTVTLAALDYAATGSTNLSNYSLPSSISGAVGTISKAPLMVTGNSSATTYNGANQSVFGYTISGLQGSDTIASLNGIFATGAIGKAAGHYVNTVSAVEQSNYTVTSINGVLDIAQANATVTGNSGTLTYNGTPQTVSGFSASGLVGGETASVLTGVSAARTAQNAGTYVVVPSGSDGNYILSFVDGTMTIQNAPLTPALVALVGKAVVTALPVVTNAVRGTNMSTSAETMASNSGVSVDLVNKPDPIAHGLVTVLVPNETATSGAGFRFVLPDEVVQNVSSSTVVQVSQLSGAVLPSWLSFEPSTRVFEARAVPDGAFPMQVMVQLGEQKVLVVISEKQAR